MYHTITIDRNKHESFLADQRLDPATKELIKVGDRVVVCAVCKTVVLEDVWVHIFNEKHCKQTKTLNSIPQSRYVSITNECSDKENNKIIKKKEQTIEVLKGYLALMFILLIFVSGFLYFNKENKVKELLIKSEDLISENNMLNNKLVLVNDKLVHANDELIHANDELSSANSNFDKLKEELNQLSEEIPIIIRDIKFKSQNNDKIYINYGSSLNRSGIFYLYPKLFYKGFRSGSIEIRVKIYNPSGSLSKVKGSLKDYTYKEKIYITEGEGQIELIGWGNKLGGSYSAGYYRIEIWYKERCLGSDKFYVYNY